MKKICILFVVLSIILLFVAGCGKKKEDEKMNKDSTSAENMFADMQNDVAVEDESAIVTDSENPEGNRLLSKGTYKQISQDEAKALMDGEEPVIILDVRTYEEFEQGHIENALCIPVENINENSKAQIESMFTSKEQIILVYCRSGNRSKTASQRLADMGYVNVMEFGGINDWKYGTVTD